MECPPERKRELMYTFTRCARDLHFKAAPVEVCRIASIVSAGMPGGKAAPYDYWLAADFSTLERLANGTHPAVNNVLEQGP